jgi:hypothetical protein
VVEEATNEEPWEDADDLCALATAQGLTVDRDGLRRLHRAGVIERPRQHSRGALGSQTLYPPGTATVLLDALEVHRKQRNLRAVAWTMWWRGLTRPNLAARKHLTTFAQKLLGLERRLINAEGSLTEEAEDVLDRAGTARLSKPLRQMRRRVGADRFEEVMQAIIYVAAGQAATLGPETLWQLEHAMGMDRARTDVLGSIHGPWLDGDVRQDMVTIGELASAQCLLGALEAASDEDIDVARDEVVRFATGIAGLAYAMRRTIDNWAYGMAGWGPGFEEMLADMDGQAYLILIWLRCHQFGLGTGMQTVLDSIGTRPQVREQVDLILQLREAVPAVGAAVPRSWFKKILEDPSVQEKINAAIADVRKDHADEIDAFFARKHSESAGQG